MPSIVDLFSGVGGLSLGAARAGFEVAAAVENDPIAAAWHAKNFPATKHLQNDVASMSGADLLKKIGLSVGELDGVIGGPPCQGFSEAGARQPADPRNDLLGHFFRLVAEMRPKFFIAENVPGALATRNKEVIQRSLAHIPKNYSLLEPIAIRANEFGAATSRTRIFFIGYDSERMNPISASDFLPPLDIVKMTVGEALMGLPQIRSNWQSEEQSWRKTAELPDTTFYKLLTGCIPAGVGNPEALFRYQSGREVSGCLGTLHTPATVDRFRKLKPGETDKVSRGIRLHKDGLCPTLRAGTGVDKGSFQAVRPIHHRCDRVITPREAARLQGFPDWFTFHPTKWHSFRQIGNSVSPIVAEKVLTALLKAVTP